MADREEKDNRKRNEHLGRHVHHHRRIEDLPEKGSFSFDGMTESKADVLNKTEFHFDSKLEKTPDHFTGGFASKPDSVDEKNQSAPKQEFHYDGEVKKKPDHFTGSFEVRKNDESAEKAQMLEVRESSKEGAEAIAIEAKRLFNRRQLAKSYQPGVERLRLVLMLFMCINLFGFPTVFGEFIRAICGFVPITFFVLSGYLVLRMSERRPERIVRSIKRSAIVFGVLAVVYFVLNLLYYRLLGINIIPALASKRFWFNFLVLNVWQFDIGSAIWYVQALLYAYIIIWFLDRWKLLKYDWIIAAVLILFSIITGELSGVIRWSFLGYTYIPGNFLTRALPYILLGCFLRRNTEKLKKLGNGYCIVMIFAGIFLMLFEIIFLGRLGVPGYYGHLLGMPLVAVACVLLASRGSKHSGFEKKLGLSRWHINGIYYLCQPVSILLVVLLSWMSTAVMAQISGFLGILTFLVCLGIVWLIARIEKSSAEKKAKKKADGQKTPVEAK